jgi:hypothetical protein
VELAQLELTPTVLAEAEQDWLLMVQMLLDLQAVQVVLAEVEAVVHLLLAALAATEFFTSSIKRIKQ